MSAIRMEEDHSITVLIDPQNKDGETIQGVYLTRDYKNPSGILPEEHIFISNDEQWFYWLGYHKVDYIPDTDSNNIIVEKINSYVNEYSIENQERLFIESQCKQCGKQETLWCIMQCPYSN